MGSSGNVVFIGRSKAKEMGYTREILRSLRQIAAGNGHHALAMRLAAAVDEADALSKAVIFSTTKRDYRDDARPGLQVLVPGER